MAEARRRRRAYDRLAVDWGGLSTERRPLPRRRERPSNSAAARKRGDRLAGGRQPSRAPADRYRQAETRDGARWRGRSRAIERGRANARGAEQPIVYRGERMVRARSVPSSRPQSGVKWRASGAAGRAGVVGQSLCYGVQQLGVSPLARASWIGGQGTSP